MRRRKVILYKSQVVLNPALILRQCIWNKIINLKKREVNYIIMKTQIKFLKLLHTNTFSLHITLRYKKQFQEGVEDAMPRSPR